MLTRTSPFLWQFPDFNLKEMSRESMVDAMGQLAAALASKGELTRAWGEDFAAMFDEWASSEQVTSFQRDAAAMVNGMVDSSLAPFQDLGTRSK